MFTPLNEKGERLRFEDVDVRWLSGELRRGPGLHGIIEIEDRGKYEVWGHPCSLTRPDGSGCYCDAVLREVACT